MELPVGSVPEDRLAEIPRREGPERVAAAEVVAGAAAVGRRQGGTPWAVPPGAGSQGRMWLMPAGTREAAVP